MIQSPLQHLLRIWMTTPTKTTTTTVAAVRDGESADRRCGNDRRRHPCPHPRQRHALWHQCGRRDHHHQHHRVVMSSPRHILASLSLLSLVLTTFTAAIALASIIAAAVVVTIWTDKDLFDCRV